MPQRETVIRIRREHMERVERELQDAVASGDAERIAFTRIWHREVKTDYEAFLARTGESRR